MATNKFYQFNPDSTNQETDAAYLADTQREDGISTNEIVPSVMLNKVLHQVSTLCAALAQAMSNKGNDMDDSDLSALTTILADLLTISELPTYFESSLLQNGYQKLPGGKIEQWGFIAMHSEDAESLVFPIAFPTKLLNITGSILYTNADRMGGTVAANFYITGVDAQDRLGCTVIADQYMTSGSALIQGVFWRAIGY